MYGTHAAESRASSNSDREAASGRASSARCARRLSASPADRRRRAPHCSRGWSPILRAGARPYPGRPRCRTIRWCCTAAGFRTGVELGALSPAQFGEALGEKGALRRVLRQLQGPLQRGMGGALVAEVR